ncbi:unnamed protein product, partial [Linum tenue]
MEEEEEETSWKALWKWQESSRIKHFLWLVLHDKLFTNKKRAIRTITTDSSCNHCKENEETTDHILINHQNACITWKPPDVGWIQLQTDGSVIQPSGRAAVGGLLRDHLGRCLDAFTCNLDVCTITSAELKGAIESLRIAWERGHRKVILNMDSTTTNETAKNCIDDDHRHGILARQFFVLNRDWEVKINHVFRD